MAVTEDVEDSLHDSKSSDQLVSSPLPPLSSRVSLLYLIVTQHLVPRAEHITKETTRYLEPGPQVYQ